MVLCATLTDQIYSLAQEQNNPELIIGAYQSLVSTLYHMGDFDSARQYAMRAVEIWRSRDGQSVLND
jgi:calcineurin-like phosphoesterase family protein